jgi:hypothetical protein
VELLCRCLPRCRPKLFRRSPAARRRLSRILVMLNVRHCRRVVEGVVLEVVAARLRPEAGAPLTWHKGSLTARVTVMAAQGANTSYQLLFHLSRARRAGCPSDLWG